MYIELTKVADIANAQSKMNVSLQKQFPHKQVRVIGWPSGHFQASVRFERTDSIDTFWWYHGPSEGDKHINLLGRGNPQDTKTLFIDLQFNFPATTFSRGLGGVFIRDTTSGKILLGHRGIVTRGKSRVPRNLIIQEADITSLTIDSEISPNTLDVFPVAPIDDGNLSKLIEEFATEVRRAANVVMEDDYLNSISLNSSKDKRNSSSKTSPLDIALNEYRDEFMGKVRSSRAAEVTMDCRHGYVVKALRNALATKGDLYKSGAMDLVLMTDSDVHLYEVKTGASSQAIYTGVGQLYFHAAALARKFPTKKVNKHLVLPFAPKAETRKNVCKELGLNIVTFAMSGGKVTITSGL